MGFWHYYLSHFVWHDLEKINNLSKLRAITCSSHVFTNLESTNYEFSVFFYKERKPVFEYFDSFQLFKNKVQISIKLVDMEFRTCNEKIQFVFLALIDIPVWNNLKSLLSFSYYNFFVFPQHRGYLYIWIVLIGM